MYSFTTLVTYYFLTLSLSPFPVVASQKHGNPGGGVFPEITELVPGVSEESRSEFASATPGNRKVPGKDTKEAYTMTQKTC